MNYRDLQNISNLSQEILIEGANEEHNVLNRWPYTSPYLQDDIMEAEVLAQKGGVPGSVKVKPALSIPGTDIGVGPNKPVPGTFTTTTPGQREQISKGNTTIDRGLYKQPRIGAGPTADERSRYNTAKVQQGSSNRMKTEAVDLYDIILSHLLDEGYAETQEAAEAIMVNMSEDWRESIIEAVDDTHSGHPNYKGPSQDPLSRANRAIGNAVNFATGQEAAEVRAKQKGVPGNVVVKQSGPFSTKNVPTKGSFISDTEMKRRGQSTKPMGPIGQ